MKTWIASALALSFAMAAPAYAESPFRTAAPEAFTAQDLQTYGLSPAEAARAASYQEQGYEIKVLTAEEAQAYKAGITDNQWLLLGILAGVIIIAVAVG